MPPCRRHPWLMPKTHPIRGHQEETHANSQNYRDYVVGWKGCMMGCVLLNLRWAETSCRVRLHSCSRPSTFPFTIRFFSSIFSLHNHLFRLAEAEPSRRQPHHRFRHHHSRRRDHPSHVPDVGGIRFAFVGQGCSIDGDESVDRNGLRVLLEYCEGVQQAYAVILRLRHAKTRTGENLILLQRRSRYVPIVKSVANQRTDLTSGDPSNLQLRDHAAAD